MDERWVCWAVSRRCARGHPSRSESNRRRVLRIISSLLGDKHSSTCAIESFHDRRHHTDSTWPTQMIDVASLAHGIRALYKYDDNMYLYLLRHNLQLRFSITPADRGSHPKPLKARSARPALTCPWGFLYHPLTHARAPQPRARHPLLPSRLHPAAVRSVINTPQNQTAHARAAHRSREKARRDADAQRGARRVRHARA